MRIDNFEKQQYIELIFQYEYDGYRTYSISGENKFFRGKSTICLEDELYVKFKDNILSLEIGEEVRINDFDSDAFIGVRKKDGLGHYRITYQIGGTHHENYCKLVLDTDEIGIKNLIILGS